ncbi:dipeptidase [Clostridium ganghwense]|uniref:Dipeptidase n=1 Tax=Clostridium ganghwense TaxID=312089 RepID=A0ABT4CR63_9CLOT|nr:dipeptidase [Clostridium ganghwense]MCY6371418.1 dipeptidase [Clostridium ganghwense]
MDLIDFHCDTISKIYKDNSELFQNNYSVDINKLKSGNSIAQFFALFIELNKVKNPLEYTLKMLDRFYIELEKNKDYIALARNYDELIKNKAQNKISAFLTIEEGAALKGNISNLRNFHRLGVKLLTLTWNFPNEIGYPNCIKKDMNKGLTPFGIEAIQEMNKLKMIIDVSHLSDGGFYDVLKYSKSPFVASHSNARAITNNPRNLTDDMIKSLSEKGGLIGLNFFGQFLGGNKFSKIDDMITHIKHIKNIGGIDVISMGSDFDGINSKLEIEHIGEMDKLFTSLKKNNFSESEIEKIFYKNALRFLKEID